MLKYWLSFGFAALLVGCATSSRKAVNSPHTTADEYASTGNFIRGGAPANAPVMPSAPAMDTNFRTGTSRANATYVPPSGVYPVLPPLPGQTARVAPTYYVPAPVYPTATVAMPEAPVSTGNFIVGTPRELPTAVTPNVVVTTSSGSANTVFVPLGQSVNPTAVAAVTPPPAWPTPTTDYTPVTTAPRNSAPSNFIGGNVTPTANHFPVDMSGGVRLFLPPYFNATADEHAARALTEVTASVLLDRHINLIQTEPALARSRMENAAGPEGLYLDAARSVGATHLLIGTVHEYRYKTDLDGSPTVGITLRLVSAADGRTIWQQSRADSSRFTGSLTKVAQRTVRDLVAKSPLEVK